MTPGTNTALSDLRDIHLPVEPGWWPPAVGWWAVAVAGVLLGFAIYRTVVNYIGRGRALREFRHEIRHLGTNEEMVHRDVQEMSRLLRRLAISVVGRNQAASVNGPAWLALLDELSDSDQFSNGPGQILADGPYRQSAPKQVDELRQLLLGMSIRRPVA